MTLMAIKNHMMQVKISNIANLCKTFNSEPDLMRSLLSHWIRKGKMRQCTKKPACGTKCFNCPAMMIEMYEWLQ